MPDDIKSDLAIAKLHYLKKIPFFNNNFSNEFLKELCFVFKE